MEAQIVQRGFSVPSPDFERLDIRSTYLDFGFASRWYLGHGPTSLYIEAGTAISILVSATANLRGESADAQMSGLDVAYVLGFGSKIKLGGSNVDLRLRYLHGLLNLNDAPAGDVGGRIESFNRALLTQVGIWF